MNVAEQKSYEKSTPGLNWSCSKMDSFLKIYRCRNTKSQGKTFTREALTKKTSKTILVVVRSSQSGFCNFIKRPSLNQSLMSKCNFVQDYINENNSRNQALF